LKVRELALKGVDLWLNLEISNLSSEESSNVEGFLKQRFKVDKLNPLLKVLGLLEVFLIENEVASNVSLSEEEREKEILRIVDDLAKKFPEIVSEMESILETISGKISEFKSYAKEYEKGQEEVNG
jgi:hypothetical protein